MSTVLSLWKSINSSLDFHITGVIEPAISAALDNNSLKIGVVGGRRTILSGSYSIPLRNNSRNVTQRIAQPLSAIIENGEKNSQQFQIELQKIMSPLKTSEILILACTHYPAEMESFQKYAPNAQIINPASETFQRVVLNWNLTINSASDVFYTTGNPEQMRNSAYNTFKVVVDKIEGISIDLKTV